MQRKVTRLKKYRQTDWSPQRVAYYSHLLDKTEEINTIYTKSILSISVSSIGFIILLSSLIPEMLMSYFKFLSLSVICFMLAIISSILIWLYEKSYFEIALNCCEEDSLSLKEKLWTKWNSMNKFYAICRLMCVFSFGLAVILVLIFFVYFTENKLNEIKIKSNNKAVVTEQQNKLKTKVPKPK